MAQRTKVELGATCSTCDMGDRRSLMRSGELYCKRNNRRVSTNGLCAEYKHCGATLTQITRRAEAGKIALVVQNDLFDQ